MNPVGRFIEVAGGSLWAETAGVGTPLVLVHGFSFDLSSWDDQFAALARTHAVTRYDLRGFGRSSLPQGPYSHVDDLLQLLQQVTAGPAHVVGLSLGANVALSLALLHPQAVRSLVLASSGLPGHAWIEPRPPEAALEHAKQHGAVAAKAFWLAHPLFASAHERPAVAERLRDMVQRYSGWHWAHDNPMRPLEATLQRLGDVKAPALVISGEHDVQGYRAIARELADGIDGARLVRVANAGHLVNMEAPVRFNDEVLAFVAAHGVPDTDRLPPIPPERWTAQQRSCAQEIVSGPRGALVSPFVPLLRSPELMQHAQRMGEYLRYRSAIGLRLSEFAILLTARCWSQQVEWAIHAPIAEREGVSAATIQAVAEGRRPAQMQADEAVIYDFCTELGVHRGVSDATWANAVAAFGEQGVVDLLGVTGYYSFLAMVMNAARTVAPSSSAPRLAALAFAF